VLPAAGLTVAGTGVTERGVVLGPGVAAAGATGDRLWLGAVAAVVFAAPLGVGWVPAPLALDASYMDMNSVRADIT
jgi:hypothetical protein